MRWFHMPMRAVCNSIFALLGMLALLMIVL